jgi:TolB-like protein/Flp pilus assembly protein TadD
LKRSLFSELRRRNVFRAAILYVGAVWAFGQGLSQFSPALGLPDWATRWFLVAAAIGFPLWVAFAWFFEFTPEGLKRESEIDPADSISAHAGRKIDFAIIGVLAIAVVLLLTDRFVLRHGVNQEAGVAISNQSIAVLPFVNMSSDKEQEYFSDGISEELLDLLAKVPQLQVTARTSSFSFKGKQVGVKEIASTLNVAHVLEGSVRKFGGQVRITAQLINAATDKHIWSQTYERKLDDVFAIQDEIAADVVRALKVVLLGAAPKVRTTTPEAYALYLQGNEAARPNTAEALDASSALYRRALEIDPKYVPAIDGLARNADGKAFASFSLDPASRESLVAEARDLAERELAIAPDYARAHGRVATNALRSGDLAGAVRHFQDALALDPSDPIVLGNSAFMLMLLGRFDQAIAVREALLRRDPVNVMMLQNLAVLNVVEGRYDEATAYLRTVLSLAPSRVSAKRQLTMILLLKGDAKTALPEIEQETEEESRLRKLSMAYHALGRKAESDAALQALTGKFEADDAFQIAEVHAFRGEADEAFAWLEKAYDRKDPGLQAILNSRPLERVHADQRWLPFLRKIGRDPEALAKIEFKVTLPKEWQAETTTASSAAKP